MLRIFRQVVTNREREKERERERERERENYAEKGGNPFLHCCDRL